MAGDGDFCVYDDIATLASKPRCVRHKASCPLASVTKKCMINVTGWSCKQLSSCNSEVKVKSRVLKDQVGSIGSTFQGIVDTLKQADGVGFYIGENVNELSKLGSENREHLVDRFSNMGWVLSTTFLQALQYGCHAS